MRATLSWLLVLTLAISPTASIAAEKPFFRLGGAVVQGGATTPVGGTLAFTRADTMPSQMAIYSAVQAYFTTVGGG